MPDIGRQHRIILVVIEHHDFRELALGPERVNFEIAEQAAKGNMLCRGDILIAGIDHLVSDQGFFKRVGGRLIDLAREVETVNFRPDGRPDWFDIK